VFTSKEIYEKAYNKTVQEIRADVAYKLRKRIRKNVGKDIFQEVYDEVYKEIFVEALNDANEDIDMNSTADGQLRLDGSGYAGAIALNTEGMNIYTNASSRDIIFGVNETERMRIINSGGITFNGDTAAANALDEVRGRGTSTQGAPS